MNELRVNLNDDTYHKFKEGRFSCVRVFHKDTLLATVHLDVVHREQPVKQPSKKKNKQKFYLGGMGGTQKPKRK